jgi:putative endonuclease
MQTTTIELGASSETRAVELLLRKGYRIVERNFRCKTGELDIIARDRDVLVFVEVRSRSDGHHGNAVEMVTVHKQRKVSRAAMQYIAFRRPRFDQARFDVIGITGADIVHIEDAWRLPG